jgi:hypothetical protein
LEQLWDGTISAKKLSPNSRCAICAEAWEVKPMNNRIELNSFSILSFDVIVCRGSAKARQGLQPMPAHRLTLTQDGRLLVEILSPTFSVKTNRQVPSGYGNAFEQMRMNARLPQPQR